MIVARQVQSCHQPFLIVVFILLLLQRSMPACNPNSKKAKDRVNYKCNTTTGRWVSKSRSDLVAAVIRGKEKTQAKREALKVAKREMKTLHKMQKLYYELCLQNAKLKVQTQLLQRQVNVLEDKMPKKRKPKVKKPAMKNYTQTEINKLHEEAAAKQAARMNEIIERQIDNWKQENPGVALPVDFQAEADHVNKAKAPPSVVNILIPRKKVKKV